jgi:uncharacterized protein YfaS (alpha-2-macroglobulin family)
MKTERRFSIVESSSILRISLTVLILFIISLMAACRSPSPTATPGKRVRGTDTPPAATDTTEPTARPTATRVPLPPTNPILIEHSPARGEEAAVDGAIEIRFDQAMDKRSVESALDVSTGGDTPTRVNGSVEWPDEVTLHFTPSVPLDRASLYQVRLGTEAKSKGGLALQREVVFDFATVGYLEVSQVIPAPNTTDVASDTTVTVMFNRPVVPLVAVSDVAREALPRPLILTRAVDGAPVEGTGEWLNTSIFVFEPSQPLQAGQRYQGQIAAGLTDSTGGVLTEDYTWSFYVEPPSVVWTAPGDGAQDVRPTEVISVTFSQPMERASAERAFSLHWNDARGPKVSGRFQWAENTELPNTEMGFVSQERLELESTYYAVVSIAATAQGGAAGLQSDYAWSFDTFPYPRITQTEPTDGNRAADPGTGIDVQFSAPINPTTVMPHVTVIPTPTQVYTYWSDYSYRFTIAFDSLPSTDYQVTIAPGINDPYGNATDEETVVNYTTRALDPMAWLNVPGDVGSYNGYASTELFAYYRNVASLDLALYAMPLDDFLRVTGAIGGDQWQAWREYQPRPEDLIRHWTEKADAELNETALVRLKPAGPEGGALTPGIYYLELSAPELQREDYGPPSRHVLVVSKTQLTLKIAQREALVWATDLKTGEPLPNLAITLDGQQPLEAQLSAYTGADGIARFQFADPVEVWAERYVLSGSEPYGDDFGISLSEWAEGISPWDFNIDSRFQVEPYSIYFYTDRPIYRPGQPVYFKGIVRLDDDARYELPGDLRELSVEIRDDEGKLVYEDVLPISDMGTLDGQFTLDDEARLGFYYLSTTVEDDAGREYGYGVSFRVAEYRKPEFQVEVTTDRDQYLSGDTIDVMVKASYFFGGPAANARVQWSLLTSDYAFRWSGPGPYDWTDSSTYQAGYGDVYYPGFGELVADGEGTTDAQGNMIFSVPADIADRSASQSFTIDVTVTDLNGQAVSGRTSVIVHKGEFYTGLAPQRYVGKVGEESAVDVRTVDWNGSPWPNQGLTVTYNERTWYSVREEDSQGRLFWTWTYSDTAVFTETLTTDGEGVAVTSFVPTEGGSYIVRAVGQDSKGNEVRSSTWVWISSQEYVSWRVENNDRIDLVADKDSYRPGETATVLIPSPFQGQVQALLTVERGRILDSRVITLRSNSELVKVPVTADMAPNAYVSIVMVKGIDETNPLPAFKVGYAALQVSTEQQELRLTLTPNKDIAAGQHYSPRESVTYEIQATDYTGNPVSAEISLNLTDLSVLSLAEPNAPALRDFFYGQRGLGVRTATGLTLAVDRLNEKIVEEVKGGGGGALSADVEIRRDFPDTAYWAPALRTDENGRATIQVDLPDSLTTWRLVGKAITANTLVGEGQVDIISTKDLLVRPVTPRFLVVGDRAELAAVVHNNTPEDLTVDVTLNAQGLSLESDSTHSVEIPAGGMARVEWTVMVPGAPGTEQFADLTFSARGGAYSDASKPTLGVPPDQLIPIYKYSTPEVVGTAGDIEADSGDTRLEAIVLPQDVDTTQGELTVQIDPSLAAGMSEGLHYLEHYPYECTEQTVSRFLPNVLTYRALQELDLVKPELESDLRRQVAVGLQRLYSNQHADGGWGWWVKDESDPAVSAWVVFGLVKAQQSGFSVDDQVVNAGIGFLQGRLVAVNRLRNSSQVNRQAFILYVLAEAGQPDVGRTTLLFEERGKLSHYGRAYLALAFHLIGPEQRSQIETLLSDLNSAAILSATGTYWQENTRDRWNWNTDTRSTAIILDTLARLDPNNRLAPNAVRWLMAARTAGHWETTQETAWSLIALTDWMAMTGELEGNYAWGVQLNGELLAQDNITRENIQDEKTLHVAVAELLQEEANRLVIEKGAGPGHLYYTAHLQTFLPVEEVKALNRGIIVGRQYTLASCEPTRPPTKEQTDQQTNPTCPSVNAAEVGETVRVKLTIIAPTDLYYVVVEDPIPAGTEAVDESLKTTSVVGEAPELRWTDPWSWDGWGWWWFSHTELRDEKAVLFASYLPAGTYEYTYLIRPSLQGEYKVLPTTAYEMYSPEVFGRGDGMMFRVND